MTYASAKDIQAKLPADEVLVEYYYDDKKVYAFVITRDRLQVVWLEGGNLAQDVKAFREALDSPKDNRYLRCRRNFTASCSSRLKRRSPSSTC